MPRKKGCFNQEAPSDAPGITLEKLVARIQQMMDPNSTVTHNEVLEDRVGNKRQFDVVIRGVFGGRPVLGVMECKDHSRRKGPDAVEAFAKKSENLGANLRIIVAKKGFTDQALRLAKHEGIGCVSLLPRDPEQVGFSIGDFWYGILSRWDNLRLTVHFPTPVLPVASFNIDTVKYDGKLVIRWFYRELVTKHGDECIEGDQSLEVTFDAPTGIEIEGSHYLVSGITCTARRIYKKKRMWVHWSGDAFYDWHTSQMTIPSQGSVIGSGVETDLSNWPDFEGDIPDLGAEVRPAGFLTAVFYNKPKWNSDYDSETPDLSVL